MKTQHIAAPAHHTHAAAGKPGAATPGAGKAGPGAANFAQMLFADLGESAEAAIDADALTTVAADDPAAANAASEAGLLVPTADGTAQAVMALLGQAGNPAASTAVPNDPVSTTSESLADELGSAAPGAITPYVAATADNTTASNAADLSVADSTAAVAGEDTEPSTPVDLKALKWGSSQENRDGAVIKPAGRELPTQAVARGLQDRQGPDASTTTQSTVPGESADKPVATKAPQASDKGTPQANSGKNDRLLAGSDAPSTSKDHKQHTQAPASSSVRPSWEPTATWPMNAAGQPVATSNPTAAEAVPTAGSELMGAIDTSRSSDNASSRDPSGGQREPQAGASSATEALNRSNDNSTDVSMAPSDSFAMSLGQALGDAVETLGAQVSYWAAQNTKHASMHLDAGLDSPLSVDVALDQGQVQIAFRTDDQAAQAVLKSHAQSVLSDLLNQSGMWLSGFSVGSHTSPGQGQNPNAGNNAWRGLNRSIERVPGSAEGPVANRTPGPQRTNGLSVYA